MTMTPPEAELPIPPSSIESEEPDTTPDTPAPSVSPEAQPAFENVIQVGTENAGRVIDYQFAWDMAKRMEDVITEARANGWEANLTEMLDRDSDKMVSERTALLGQIVALKKGLIDLEDRANNPDNPKYSRPGNPGPEIDAAGLRATEELTAYLDYLNYAKEHGLDYKNQTAAGLAELTTNHFYDTKAAELGISREGKSPDQFIEAVNNGRYAQATKTATELGIRCLRNDGLYDIESRISSAIHETVAMIKEDDQLHRDLMAEAEKQKLSLKPDNLDGLARMYLRIRNQDNIARGGRPGVIIFG